MSCPPPVPVAHSHPWSPPAFQVPSRGAGKDGARPSPRLYVHLRQHSKAGPGAQDRAVSSPRRIKRFGPTYAGPSLHHPSRRPLSSPPPPGLSQATSIAALPYRAGKTRIPGYHPFAPSRPSCHADPATPTVPLPSTRSPARGSPWMSPQLPPLRRHPPTMSSASSPRTAAPSAAPLRLCRGGAPHPTASHHTPRHLPKIRRPNPLTPSNRTYILFHKRSASGVEGGDLGSRQSCPGPSSRHPRLQSSPGLPRAPPHRRRPAPSLGRPRIVLPLPDTVLLPSFPLPLSPLVPWG